MNNKSHENALDIIRRHQRTLPVNVIAIADDLEINVYTAKDADGLSGKIAKDAARGGASGYAIFVNGQDSSKRQRFTIAHEIAHFILHQNEIGDGIVDDALYRSGLSNKQEAEANKLAAEILMPFELISKAINDNVKTIQDLAAIFQVSESAMSIRIGVPC